MDSLSNIMKLVRNGVTLSKNQRSLLRKRSMKCKEKRQLSMLGNKNGYGNRGKIRTREMRDATSILKKGKPLSEEHKKKCSIALKGRSYEDLFGKEKAKEERNKRAYIKTPEHVEKVRLSNIGKKHPSMIGNTQGFKKGQTPWNRGLTAKTDKRVENNTINVLKAVCASPNKFETKCLALLQNLYPNKFKYTGDGTCIINGRSADAYSLELNTIVLFHGVYWHLERGGLVINEENKRSVEKVDSLPFLFAGYKVIFLWEDEIY
jgi:hypothetical protein